MARKKGKKKAAAPPSWSAVLKRIQHDRAKGDISDQHYKVLCGLEGSVRWIQKHVGKK